MAETKAAPRDTAVASGAQRLAVLGWLTGSLFFFYAWVLRVAPSVIVDDLMREFAVGAAAIGNLSAFYFYGYAGLQIPIGMIIDRFGPRRPIALAALATALGCVIFAFGTSLWTLAAGRFLIGAAAAFSLVGAMAVAGQWFPPRRFALLSGIAMMLGMAGGVFGQAPLRLLVERTDWRSVMLMTAIGGVVLSLLAVATIRDRQRGSGGFGQVLGGLGRVVANRQTWLISFAGLGSTGPLLGFAGLWGVPYLTATQGFTRTEAASLTSLLFIGWGIGAPLIGWLSDRLGRRRIPFAAGMALCTASLATLVYAPDLSTTATAVLCFLCGFGGSSQIVGFAAAREHNVARLSGTAIGFVNGMVTGAGALYQPLLGALLDLGWTGQIVAGARIYDIAAYRAAFTVLVVGAAVGTLCALAMRETWCKPVATETDNPTVIG